MTQPTRVRTVPALGLLLLLGSLGLGGCACTDNGDLRDLGALLCCSHEPHQRCERRVAVPCDPCYGFHPTQWHAWPEYCPGLSPGGARPAGTAMAGAGTLPQEPANMEVVPTPQEPQVINLPPPPEARMPVRASPLPPLPEEGSTPAAEKGPAPLPDKGNDHRESKDRKESGQKGEPQAQHWVKPRPATVGSDTHRPAAGDVANAKELVALRDSVSPPSPRTSLAVIAPSPRATDAEPRHWQEAVVSWFTCDELLWDHSLDVEPRLGSVAVSVGQKLFRSVTGAGRLRRSIALPHNGGF